VIATKKRGAIQMLVISTIRKLGLATSKPARIWRTEDRDGRVSFVEMFEWKDARAPEIAEAELVE
jgi:hypothetical protein